MEEHTGMREVISNTYCKQRLQRNSHNERRGTSVSAQCGSAITVLNGRVEGVGKETGDCWTHQGQLSPTEGTFQTVITSKGRAWSSQRG